MDSVDSSAKRAGSPPVDSFPNTYSHAKAFQKALLPLSPTLTASRASLATDTPPHAAQRGAHRRELLVDMRLLHGQAEIEKHGHLLRGAVRGVVHRTEGHRGALCTEAPERARECEE